MSEIDEEKLEKEEVKEEVKKKTGWILVITIIAAVLLTSLFFLWFFYLRPSIDVPDFVGQSKDDVNAWIKQYDIAESGVVFKEEYNFIYEPGMILNQDPAAGKIKSDTKLTFLVSKGPDPNEELDVPNLESMSQDDVEVWIKENKLLDASVSTSYHSTVPAGKVIAVEYSGCSQKTFTRGCKIGIAFSLGEKPIDEVTMKDFVGKDYSSAQSFAEENNLVFSKTESFSNTVEKDKVISQSISADEVVKAGTPFSVVVSKGKAVYLPYFEGWEKPEISEWASKNKVEVEFTSYYDDSAPGTIVYQEPAAGSLVTGVVKVIVSKGNPEINSSTLDDLKETITSLNRRENGNARLSLGTVSYAPSDKVTAGRIIGPIKAVTGQPVNVTISRGREYLLCSLKPNTSLAGGTDVAWEELVSKPYEYAENDIRWRLENYRDVTGDSISLNYEFVYESGVDDGKNNVGRLMKVYRVDGGELKNGIYITQDIKIILVVCDSLR